MTLSIFYTNYLQLHWVHRCFRTYYICFSMACFVTYQTTIPASVRFPSDPMVNSFIAYTAVTATEIENIRYHCLWFYIYYLIPFCIGFMLRAVFFTYPLIRFDTKTWSMKICNLVPFSFWELQSRFLQRFWIWLGMR